MLKHNVSTLNEVEYYTAKGEHCCVVNPCGSGKTSIMSAFIRNHPSATFLVLTKQANAAEYYRQKDPVFAEDRVLVATYNRMHNDVKAGKFSQYKRSFYLVDEAHYLGAPLWSGDFWFLVKRFNPIRIGLTATPQRLEDQGSERDIVKDFFSGNYAGNYTASDLCKAGVFQEPEYVMSFYNLEKLIDEKRDRVIDSELSEEEKKYLVGTLDSALDIWNKNSSPKIVLRQYLPQYMYKPRCNRILVYVSNVNDIPEKKKFIDSCVSEIFPGASLKSYVYTHKVSDSVLSAFETEDETYIKILYAIDKIMETIHIDDLRIAIMMRPSASKRIITQQFGRVNSIGSTTRPLIIDMVDNLSKMQIVATPEDERRIMSARTPRQPNSEENTRRQNKPALAKRDLPHITYYAEIFSHIDFSLRRVQYYTVNGFTGTLSEICYVYDVSVNEVDELLKSNSIEDAIAMAHQLRTIPPKDFEYDTDGYVLSDEDWMYAQKNIGILERMFVRRKITDEDIRQELTFCFYKEIAKTSQYEEKTTSKCSRNLRIILNLTHEYLRICRNNVRGERFSEPNLLSDEQEDPAANFLTDFDAVTVKMLSRELETVLETLKPREAKVLRLHFGLIDPVDRTAAGPMTLEEIGKVFGVTRETIRQVEAKALRKLRHPSRSKKLRDYLA